MYYIEIEDLVGNALIQLLEKFHVRTISFDELTQYGNIVVQKLLKDNKQVIALYTKDRRETFFNDYTDFFDVTENSITLKETVSLDDLKKEFLANIALDVFLAFMSKEAVDYLQSVA